MKKILSALRWNLLNFFVYFFRKKNEKEGRDRINTVYLDLKDNYWHRYLAILLLFFHQREYRIVIKYNYFFWGSWSTFLLLKLNIPFQLVLNKPQRISIGFGHKDKADELLQLSDNYFIPDSNNSYHVPMCMVDTIYVEGFHKYNCEKEYTQKRRLKIFFTGRLNEKAYNNNILMEKFNVLSRVELLNETKKRWADIIHTPSKEEDLFNENEYRLVLGDRDIYNVPASRLRFLLSDCDFFLAFPGVVMPLCHNIIEAMSCGVIPILQYNQWFYPPLVDKKNCLSFSNVDEYQRSVDLAMTMNQEEVIEMRRNVFDYYNNYLSPDAVIKKLESINMDAKDSTILLNGEYQSVKIMPDYARSL